MDPEKISRFENLLGRALRPEEKERLERIQNCLGIRSSDALWDIITALEYQRTYYEDMPAKIRESTADILKDFSSAAEKKVTDAHSRLAEHVVQQAQALSQSRGETVISEKTWQDIDAAFPWPDGIGTRDFWQSP